MRLPRRIAQWPLLVIGAWLHALSAGDLPTDDDTKADWPDNLQLDRQDADGDHSDGMQDGWHRLRTEGWRRWPHNLKNLWREWIEIVHPKTAARVSGLFNAGSLVVGVAIGGALVGWLI